MTWIQIGDPEKNQNACMVNMQLARHIDCYQDVFFDHSYGDKPTGKKIFCIRVIYIDQEKPLCVFYSSKEERDLAFSRICEINKGAHEHV